MAAQVPQALGCPLPYLLLRWSARFSPPQALFISLLLVRVYIVCFWQILAYIASTISWSCRRFSFGPLQWILSFCFDPRMPWLNLDAACRRLSSGVRATSTWLRRHCSVAAQYLSEA